jgi:hypothetical protein
MAAVAFLVEKYVFVCGVQRFDLIDIDYHLFQGVIGKHKGYDSNVKTKLLAHQKYNQ